MTLVKRANRTLKIICESWPLKRSFAISRDVKTCADVILVELCEGEVVARAECVPYPRYGESISSVTEQLFKLKKVMESGLSRAELQTTIGPGAARNALDCVLWDLESKLAKKPIWKIAGIAKLKPVLTAETISIDSPRAMGLRARELAEAPILKIKLDSKNIFERLKAIRTNAPKARLIIDPNESWNSALLGPLSSEAASLGVEMIEQPMPSNNDNELELMRASVAICADESCHDRSDLEKLVGKYNMINIKLDKTGGLTEALALKTKAEEMGFRIMVGCMVATSLAMAPAILIAQGASIVDLDGPLLLRDDRTPGLEFKGHNVFPAKPELWG